jgi:hypothetical protein
MGFASLNPTYADWIQGIAVLERLEATLRKTGRRYPFPAAPRVRRTSNQIGTTRTAPSRK